VLAQIARGGYVADAPVGPLGPAALVAMGVVLVAAVLLSVRARSLAQWTGLLLGCYGLALSGDLLDRFLSATRALAPCVLGAGLAVLAARLLRPPASGSPGNAEDASPVASVVPAAVAVRGGRGQPHTANLSG
jgi:hypothetical protein